MRIVGGIAGGRILKVPRGYDVRPTPDLVKQALFNSLGDRVMGSRVLELFGGSGALGLECASRGAQGVVCVEASGKHAAFIRQNLSACGLDACDFQIRTQDVFTALAQLAAAEEAFDLIIGDPPYGPKNVGHRSQSLAQRTLDDPNVQRVLRAEGLLVLGHTRRDTLTIPSNWREIKALKHGDSMVRFLTQEAPASDSATVPPAQ